MQRTILSLTPLQVNLRQGHGFKTSQRIDGTRIRIIGRIAVKSALKYSVVPEALTNPVSMIKQSNERKTLAVSPTVFTV